MGSCISRRRNSRKWEAGCAPFGTVAAGVAAVVGAGAGYFLAAILDDLETVYEGAVFHQSGDGSLADLRDLPLAMLVGCGVVDGR